MQNAFFEPDMDMLDDLASSRVKIEQAVKAAQTGDMDFLPTYTPEEFAEDMAYRFLTESEKILKYLKDTTLTYARFATILVGKSNAAFFKKEGYLDADMRLTTKGFDFVTPADTDYQEVMEDAENYMRSLSH